MSLFNPGQNSKVWFSNFGSANNTHLKDAPGDGDCMFRLFCYLAKLNGWNAVYFNPDHLRHAVSNELKTPSNGVECFFHPQIKKLRAKKLKLSSTLSLTMHDFV